MNAMKKPLTGLCMSYEGFPSAVMSRSSQCEGCFCRICHGFVLIPQHCACQTCKACVPDWQGQCSIIPLLPGECLHLPTRHTSCVTLTFPN